MAELGPIKASQARILDVPTTYVSTSATFFPGNDAVILFGRLAPANVEGVEVPAGTQAAVNQPVAIIQMSAATAKDLFLALSDQIEGYEKRFGKIETEYSRRIAKK
jgi:hypothetical protein